MLASYKIPTSNRCFDSGCPSANRKSSKTVGIDSMPIELLVPIGIFVVGILVSIAASSLGIERIIEGSKK
jgi:hypothetical protein